MKSCERREPDVLLHAHGHLTGIRRVMLEDHLRSCHRCRARWARWSVERIALRRQLGPAPRLGNETSPLLSAVACRVRREPQEPVDEKQQRQIMVPRHVAVVAFTLLATLGAVASAAYSLGYLPQNQTRNLPSAPSSDQCGSCHQQVPTGHPPVLEIPKDTPGEAEPDHPGPGAGSASHKPG